MIKKLFGPIMLAGILAITLTSCGDDTGPQFGQGVSPIQSFVNRLVLLDADDNEPVGTYGTILEFQKAGRITQLCLMAPIDENFVLALWDLTDTTRTHTIVVEADSGVVECVDVSNVSVDAGSRFAVSMTGPGLFIWNSSGLPGGGSSIFPSTIFDITLVTWGFSDNPEGVNFPADFDTRVFGGLADIVFEPKLE